MGAEPWSIYAPYSPDLQQVLDNARQQVFAAGEFRFAEEAPNSIEEALEIADCDGTASILDIQEISESPEYCCAAPFTEEELESYFGTTRPTRTEVATAGFWEQIERGQARYVIVYANDQPQEVYFAGYSFD